MRKAIIDGQELEIPDNWGQLLSDIKSQNWYLGGGVPPRQFYEGYNYAFKVLKSFIYGLFLQEESAK